MELLTVPTLRSHHGFPTRAGGRSSGAFSSLNTSFSVGDDVAAVSANLELVAGAAQVAITSLFTATQVHGDRIVEGERVGAVEADGLITRRVGEAVAVRTADCVPVLIECRRTGAVAAVHAGWRGVMNDIVLRALERLGGRPEDLRVGIGPCIQRCCFEVGGDLPDRFASKFGTAVVARPEGTARVHLDLVAALRITTARAGIPAGHVAALPHCTQCDERFFSHRRDHGITGRHLSFITCGPASDL